MREQVLESDLTWKKITQFVTGIVDKEHEAINEGLKEILQAAKQIGKLLFVKDKFFKFMMCCEFNLVIFHLASLDRGESHLIVLQQVNFNLVIPGSIIQT